MIVPRPVAIILVVALVVDVGAFFALGLGTHALCVVGCPAQPLQQLTFQKGQEVSSFVQVSSSNPTSDAYSLSSTSMLSTSVSFGLYINVNTTAVGSSQCSQQGAMDIGQGADPGWWSIALWNGTSGQSNIPFQLANVNSANGGTLAYGPLAGGATWGPVFKYYTISENASSNVIQYCVTDLLGAHKYSGGGGYYLTSFQLNGRYNDHSVLDIEFHQTVYFCNGNAFSYSAQPQTCRAPGQLISTYASSSIIGIARGTTYLLSGYSFLSPQQAVAYNGGTLAVPYVTGYDGGNTFKATFVYGPCRPNAGTEIQSVTLNQATTGVAVFNVPAGLSTSTSASSCAAPYSWNTMQVFLYSGYSLTAAIWRQLVDISPDSAPGVPTLTAVDQQGHAPAQVGDTIQLTFTAAYTIASGKISTFDIAGYYLAGESTPPVSSQYWIGGNPQGQQVTALCTGNATSGGSCSGSFSFSVTFSASVDVIVQDLTTTSQGNQNQVVVQVNPTGCSQPSCGSGGPPPATGPWQQFGPWLLAIAVILGAVLIALVLDVPTLFRAIIAGLPVGIVSALLWFGALQSAFAVGGVLA